MPATKTLSGFKVVEKISRTIQASNGLTMETKESNGTLLVTFLFGGSPLHTKDVDAGLIVQMGEMLKKVERQTKFVCATHGSFIVEKSRQQPPGCASCMSNHITNRDQAPNEEADA